MQTITITINAPEGADIAYITRRAEQAASPDWLIEAWHISDVQDAADDELTDEQCREVLRRVDRGHDCNVGINWDVIRYHADMVAEESETNSKNEVTA